MNPSTTHSKYQPAISQSTKQLVFTGLFLVLSLISFAQDKSELQQQRNQISEQIQLTNKLIAENRNSRNKKEGTLSLLNKKINLREDMIQSLNNEIVMYNRRISNNKEAIDTLKADLSDLKESYAEMIRFAQRNSRSEDRLMFIFASEDFAQAIRRIRYLKQYTQFRQKQAAEIVEKQDELNALNAKLLGIIDAKDALKKQELSTKEVLFGDLKDQKHAVAKLKQEGNSLVKRLRKQEKQREDLNKKIQRIIEAEIRASKKDNAGVFELTPEAAALSADFEKNKGKLPWPVERGVITSRFGRNPHPVLAGITVSNNGINIATSANATVRAVFKGTVSAVFSIPGAGQNIIINHGGYRSVYSRLKNVFVSEGQKVEIKQALGTVLTDEETGKTESHLEIWKVDKSGTSKQNPADWIYN